MKSYDGAEICELVGLYILSFHSFIHFFIHFILFSKTIQNFKIYIYIYTYPLTDKYTHMHACAYICVYTVYAYARVHIYIII